MDLSGHKEKFLDAFQKLREPPYVVKRSDDHIFIKFDTAHNHFWSPQLQLEIVETDENNCKLYGLFGPNPTLWTFFMFLHFGVATLFIVMAIWAYSSSALGKPYGLAIGLMIFTVLLWFALYFFGRIGKRKGKPQMQQLHQLMMDTLNKTA
tara:strand:+ start:968 stop:1420 length:453 start_codon:yes stop_codon:yes gene_type:complete